MSSTHMRKKRKTDIPTKMRNKDTSKRRRNIRIFMRKMNKRRRQPRPMLLFYNALKDYSKQKNHQILNHLNHPKHLSNLMIQKVLSHMPMILLHLPKQSKWKMTKVTTTTLNQIKRRNARTDLNIYVDSYRTELNLASRDLSHSPFASANTLLPKFECDTAKAD